MRFRGLALMLGMAVAGTASATTVYVVSVGHSNAQIIINASKVRTIQIGEIVVLDVLGIVQEGSGTVSKDVDVLLGNSFLQHVQMRRTGDTMVITKAKGM